MSGFTVSSSSSQNINNFSQLALQSVNQFRGDDKSWARHYARQFYHNISQKPGFLPVYNALLSALKSYQEVKKEEEKVSNKKEVESSSNTKPKKEKFDTEAFIKDALGHIEDFNDETEWARSYARQLFHHLDRKTPFLELYNKLLNAFDKEFQEDNISIESEEDEDDEEYLPYQHKKKSSSNTFAKDGDQTDAERKQGKYMLNKVLCKEYNDWYDAFQAEEQDELKHAHNNGQGEVESGEERWIHYASKVLSRKTNIPTQTVKPVVEAWLLQYTGRA
jgi:hypothetical protein